MEEPREEGKKESVRETQVSVLRRGILEGTGSGWRRSDGRGQRSFGAI